MVIAIVTDDEFALKMLSVQRLSDALRNVFRNNKSQTLFVIDIRVGNRKNADVA